MGFQVNRQVNVKIRRFLISVLMAPWRLYLVGGRLWKRWPKFSKSHLAKVVMWAKWLHRSLPRVGDISDHGWQIVVRMLSDQMSKRIFSGEIMSRSAHLYAQNIWAFGLLVQVNLVCTFIPIHIRDYWPLPFSDMEIPRYAPGNKATRKTMTRTSKQQPHKCRSTG